jgi:hypothetical protein
MSPMSRQMCCQAIPEPFPPEKQFEGFIKAIVGLGDLHA